MRGNEIAMIALTDEQRHQLDRGCAVEVTDSETSRPYVLLPREVYARMEHLLWNDSDSGADELRYLLARSAEANGWNEPGMDAYDRYDEEFRKQCP